MSTDPKVNYILKIVSCESTVEEVSFEWSHNRISSTDSKVELQFKNSLIIRKEKTKEIFAFMSVFIFDKNTAKLYVQYFRRKSPQI